jgi:hypothetical protein
MTHGAEVGILDGSVLICRPQHRGSHNPTTHSVAWRWVPLGVGYRLSDDCTIAPPPPSEPTVHHVMDVDMMP